MRFVLHLVPKVEDNRGRIRRRPMPNSGHIRKLRQLLRRGGTVRGLSCSRKRIGSGIGIRSRIRSGAHLRRHGSGWFRLGTGAFRFFHRRFLGLNNRAAQLSIFELPPHTRSKHRPNDDQHQCDQNSRAAARRFFNLKDWLNRCFRFEIRFHLDCRLFEQLRSECGLCRNLHGGSLGNRLRYSRSYRRHYLRDQFLHRHLCLD